MQLAFRLSALAYLLLAFFVVQVHAACLQYEPAAVSLRGKLLRRVYAAPPNYEDLHKGDRPETYWIIQLQSPTCVNEDKAEPDLNVFQRDIRSVQLVLTKEKYRMYKSLLSKRVVATGTLFGAHTAHHHTPVLMTVTTLEELHSR